MLPTAGVLSGLGEEVKGEKWPFYPSREASERMLIPQRGGLAEG